MRLYLVCLTQGTTDVELWEDHARGVSQLGLIGYYHANPLQDHPPLISALEALGFRAAGATHIPYRVWLRLPFAILDGGTAILVWLLFRESPWRFAAAAGYWLHPLAVILSAYHGNTDTAVGFSVLLCVWFLTRGKVTPAAMALGAGLWIKIPGVLAVPALLLFIQDWRSRARFLSIAAATALASYVPALCQDPAVVWTNVFGFRGLPLNTPDGHPVWGVRVPLLALAPVEWRTRHLAEIRFFIGHEYLIAGMLLLLVTWLRRPERTPAGLCATIAAGYTMFMPFECWGFQYFAWVVPFWFGVGAGFLIPASILSSAYIYALYWFLCGNPWLLGPWAYLKHANWPGVVVLCRNLAWLFFSASAVWFLLSATWKGCRQPFKGETGP